MLRRILSGVFLFSILLLFGNSDLRPQSSTARISGAISDESGAVMPGVQVLVRNTETGVQRSYTSNQQGRYVAPQLVPGSYEITATLAGFDTMVRKGITLTVGQDVSIDLTMKVGSVNEQVTVTGEAPLLDTTSSVVSGIVEERRIAELPLNGRDFSQLALVQPGVVSVRTSSAGAAFGYGARISVAGSRADQTGWLLDGTNIKSVANFGTPGSASGVMMGVEAVREFRVLSGSYSAEFGGSSGGVIQLVTKSGTNQLHGSGYEYIRNDNFDERNFFDRRKAEFRRNQFGASLGGPLRKDKAFFFGNFEGLRQATVGSTRIENVPDNEVRRGIVPGPAATTRQVTISPSVKPYLELWPAPNGPPIATGVAQLFTASDRPVDENYFVARLDYYADSSQTIFGRMTFDNGNDTDSISRIADALIFSRARYLTLQYERIVSPMLLSTSRIAYNRTNSSSDVELRIDYPRNLYFMGHRYPPTFGYTGVTSLGINPLAVSSRIQNLYEFSQGMLFSKGSHSLKFGGNFQKVGFNTNGDAAGAYGSFSWASAEDFLQDSRLLTFGVQVPGSSTFRSLRQNVMAMYVQDDWQLARNLTLNLGLRYEPFTAPSEKWDRISTIRDWIRATEFSTGGTLWNNHSKKNLSPRMGLSWDPTGNGKSAVRAGFGLFQSVLLGAYYRTIAIKNPPYVAHIETVQGNLASAASDTARVGPGLLSTTLSPNTFSEIPQWDMNQPYEMKFNLSIVREVARDVSLTVGYLGSRGIHQLRKTDANAALPIELNGRAYVPAGTPRLNRNNGVSTYSSSDSASSYHAMLIEIRKRFSQDFQLQGSYTWSKTIDDSTSGIGNVDYQEGVSSQPYATKADRGLSALHVGRNLVLNGLWYLPSPVRTGIGNHIFGGWRLSGIFSVSTGSPFSVRISGRSAQDQSRSAGQQRPDLVAGRNNSNITKGTTSGCTFGNSNVKAGQRLGTVEQYYDPCAFILPPAGFYGTAGRNFLIGPGFANLDLSLSKSIPVGINESSKLQVQADVFNLTNRANFGLPDTTVLNPANGTLVAGAGRITTIRAQARQMQFGVKLLF